MDSLKLEPVSWTLERLCSRSHFAVKSHAHHGAIENRPHDWLVSQRGNSMRPSHQGNTACQP